jgi:hypothetical protein
VTNALAGTGTLIIDAGATLTLRGAVASSQTITFAANRIAQLANDPYSPSTLVLAPAPGAWRHHQRLSFADRLVLGVTVTSGLRRLDIDRNLSTGGPLPPWRPTT